MTSIAPDIYQRALERARTAGLAIVARGWRRADGQRVVGVSSASENDRVHLVVVNDLELQCDCEAAKHNRFCQHRALVHEMLLAEKNMRADARLEAAERLLHQAAYQVVLSEAARRLPVADTRPLSLFK